MFARAYRVLGSTEDAEDAVQEALLRMHVAAQAGTEIHDPAPFALTVAARVAIDRRRCARAKREFSAGPGPLVRSDPSGEPGPAERAEIAEDLARALPMLVGSLTPLERAVWLLRETFGYRYSDIAVLVGRTESNCRQVGRRARRRIEQLQGDNHLSPPGRRGSSARAAALAREFLDACDRGDAATAVRLTGGQAALAPAAFG
jgi:RNA polymerase sigma-70 factor (ECF subfamily)